MREGTVCHEIWHATENEILSRDYTAFNWDDWNALNPAGFTYWNDSGDYDRYDARWTMFDNSEGVYFVDSYAKLAAQEDRARIMEYFMVHEDEAGLLIQSAEDGMDVPRCAGVLRYRRMGNAPVGEAFVKQKEQQ